jgi:maltose alpha-D-glucosyltransferase / alpha-amylase
MAAIPVLGASRFECVFESASRTVLEGTALPAFLARQRWFGGKARAIARVRVFDGGPLQPPLTPFLAVADVQFADGGSERYALPLTVLAQPEISALLTDRPAAAIAWIDAEGGRLLTDALADDNACRGLLAAIDARRQFGFIEGSVVSVRDVGSVVGSPLTDIPVRRSGAEQSNSSVIFGRASILKIYRRLEAGPHPELELGRYLRKVGFADVPAVLGSMEYTTGLESSALAVLHALVPDSIDGWEHALEHVGQYYARVGSAPTDLARSLIPPGTLLELPHHHLAPAAREPIGAYLEAAHTLGHQTAALHLALARGTDEALAPQPITPDDVLTAVEGSRARASRALSLLAARAPLLAGHTADRAHALLALQPALFARLDLLATARLTATKTRCHQDYHLGQLLWTGTRYALLDFEGEPARSLADRRRKRSPLTDVAGMLRSYSYAAWSGLFVWSRAHRANALERAPWATLWETAVTAAFLSSYFADTHGASFIPADGTELAALLELLMIDKALYELDYELNNRPDWLPVPVEGLLRLVR